MDSNLQWLNSQIKQIDEWLDNYEGDDEALIDRKLDQQERLLAQRSQIYNLNALCPPRA